jgi:hypothetical protein
MIPRVVVADDNRTIVLSLYRGRDAVSADLSPMHALRLAQELLDAALPKLKEEQTP